MTEELNNSTKICPICCEELRTTDFGVCRARKDGRNLYCKSCIRKKVTDSRRALKEYRSARKRYVSPGLSERPAFDGDTSQAGYSRLLSKLTPGERVKESIRKGARTQKEIRKATGLGDDQVGEALANLLLWTREIRTQMADNTRHYFLNESAELSIRTEPVSIPRRKGDVASTFSAIQGLMPGKTPEAEETEKIGGWVAA